MGFDEVWVCLFRALSMDYKSTSHFSSFSQHLQLALPERTNVGRISGREFTQSISHERVVHVSVGPPIRFGTVDCRGLLGTWPLDDEYVRSRGQAQHAASWNVAVQCMIPNTRTRTFKHAPAVSGDRGLTLR